MKKSWLVQLVFGLFLGMLLVAPWATSAPIQQQVGVNGWDPLGNRWTPNCAGDPHSDGRVPITEVAGYGGLGECADISSSLISAFNGATYDRVRIASGDALATVGILGAGNLVFNGTTWDRLRAAIGNVDAVAAANISTSGTAVFNGTTWDRVRSGTAAAATTGTGVPSSAPLFFNNTLSTYLRFSSPTNLQGNTEVPGFAPMFNNGSGVMVMPLGVSATSLTATTSLGTTLTVPHSTWSVTNTPAAATQATASRAAGAAGVRHVATTVTVCLAAGATAQTPVVVNLRDGATGAGTVLRSWAISAPVNDSKCADLSGLAMIGTAATAMTIEFAAAGVAGSQETVTLTGFSTN